jgi:hypothetical protein
MIRVTIFCLIIAIATRAAMDQRIAAQDAINNQQSAISNHVDFSSDLHHAWLTVHHADNGQRGWDASFTYALCDFKPIVKKIGPSKYEITFTSEIAEDLP